MDVFSLAAADAAADPQDLPAYVPPTLERLGAWSALTLQQSVCTGDGCAMIESARVLNLV